MISNIKEYDEELAAEATGWVNCVSDYLRRYMRFVSGCMDEKQIDRFHKDILRLLDNGIEAREHQKFVVDNELDEAYELYVDEVISEEEYKDMEEMAKEIKRALEEDKKVLRDLKTFCENAKTKQDKVLCIEKVTNTAHSRGSMLPVMCGAYLPEDILEAASRLGIEREYTRVEDVGYWLSRDTQKVLDCIKEFR